MANFWEKLGGYQSQSTDALNKALSRLNERRAQTPYLDYARLQQRQLAPQSRDITDQFRGYANQAGLPESAKAAYIQQGSQNLANSLSNIWGQATMQEQQRSDQLNAQKENLQTQIDMVEQANKAARKQARQRAYGMFGQLAGTLIGAGLGGMGVGGLTKGLSGMASGMQIGSGLGGIAGGLTGGYDNPQDLINQAMDVTSGIASISQTSKMKGTMDEIINYMKTSGFSNAQIIDSLLRADRIDEALMYMRNNPTSQTAI